ncbi:hypothetical protein [Tenacibaculum finnmarkense]|uniref:hypothetical protein n=1 Tax=Tenacibaculum finnmarkense TaxID=2781243 RepID=UPI0023019221|nr:hypothetical protein [Tenacibaculum finnmarkense]WCC46199.1 hypothetical protein PJH08_07255 [Tenacibaculum finnmarkense]
MGKIKIESSTGAKIYVNGKEYGTIKKENKEYEIENGQHEIYAKTAWCGSQKIKLNITDDKIILLTLNSFKNEAAVKAVFMLLSGLLVFTKNLIFGIIAGIVFLYPLYYITIGKDKYLELVEKK